jgi:hypothetical protein
MLTRFIIFFDKFCCVFLLYASLIAKFLSLIHYHYTFRYDRTILTLRTYRLTALFIKSMYFRQWQKQCIDMWKPHRQYPYFDLMVRLAWSGDPESYAGGSVANGRASHSVHAKLMTQTKRHTLVLEVGDWAWGWLPYLVKILLSQNLKEIKLAIEKEADQSCGGATSWRRTSDGLDVEIGDLMHSQERGGSCSLRRSSLTQGCSTIGRRRICKKCCVCINI